MDELTGVLIFSKVVEAKTFTAAAEILGISQSQVSKEISRLEKSLGARLLNRTTRRLSLTEIGSAFYEHGKRICEEYEAAKVSVASHCAEVKGLIRVTAPVAFGINHIAPGINILINKYPKLQVELILNDRTVNLAEEGIDIAIRFTQHPHDNLVARPLVPIRWVLCGAPDYFARNGVPNCLEDLSNHNCLIYPQITINNCWEFCKDERRINIAVNGNFAANNGEALCKAAIEGMGIVMLPIFIASEHLKHTRLKQILSDYEIPTTSAYAVYLPNRYLAPKVRAFIDFYISRLKSDSSRNI